MSAGRKRPADKTAEDQGFLSRWSRLKQTGGELAETQEAPPSAGAPEAAEPQAGPEDDQALLARLGLPDPDALKPGDDVSGFMARAVPSRLRNRALRRLWLTDPVLANLDELVDYGEDFTDAATVIEGLTTAYQVGRGHPRPERDETPEAAPDAGAEGGSDAEGETVSRAAEPAETPAVEAAPKAEGALAGGAVESSVDAAAPGAGPLATPTEGPLHGELSPRATQMARRRGMSFQFDDETAST